MIEIKTTSIKYFLTWEQKGIPIDYSLQVALYCHLLQVEEALILVSFLEEKDYQEPEKFIPTPENTKIYTFNIYQQHPDFDFLIQEAEEWYHRHILTGISPTYTQKDIDYVQELKNGCFLPSDEELYHMTSNYEQLILRMNAIEQSPLFQEYQELSKQKTKMNKAWKQYFLNLPEQKKEYFFYGDVYDYQVRFNTILTLNKDQLQQDGLLEKYIQRKTTSFKVIPLKKED